MVENITIKIKLELPEGEVTNIRKFYSGPKYNLRVLTM